MKISYITGDYLLSEHSDKRIKDRIISLSSPLAAARFIKGKKARKLGFNKISLIERDGVPAL